MNIKRSKLALSITTLLLCLEVMCFGVYSATRVEYSIGGNITYEVNDVFVDIDTSLYKSTQGYEYSINNMASELLNLDEYFNLDKVNTISPTLEKTDFEYSFSNRNNIGSEDTEIVTSDKELPIDFGEYAQQKSYAYYLVITVRNYGSNIISGKLNIDSLYQEDLNIYVAPLQTMEDIQPGSNSSPSSYSFVVCIALKDISQSIDAQFENVSLEINNYSLQDEVNYEDFVFNYDSGDYYDFDVCAIEEYTGSNTKVIFPKTDPNGKPVNMVGYDQWLVVPEGTFEVYIPSGVEYIPAMVFGEAESISSLRSMYIPNSVKSIGSCNTCLTKSPTFIFPSSFGTGGQYEYDIDPDITRIIDGGAISYAISSSSELFMAENGIMFSKDKTELVSYPIARIGNYEIDDGVNSIGYGAFINRINLSSIIISSSVIIIDEYAFFGCSNLIDIYIPSSVTSIGDYAFEDCSALETVTFEDTTTEWTVSNGSTTNTITSQDLQNPSTRATYLTYTYLGYTWTKNV